MIRVQREDFDVGTEIERLARGKYGVGGIVSFVGLVRDVAGGERVGAMTLEHYPGMTEKKLAEIEVEARQRWPLEDCLVVHRYGRLEAGERIVLVVTASAHRQAAFEACEFLVDWLKTKAPFWKLEEHAGGADWVEAQAEDESRASRWEAATPLRPRLTSRRRRR
ncbi:MAG TPA: molybdenum cofactor biosynthesis protein MoaE [Stellaceae bacterium]|nr:molybdenum cofactor biosynthesis protein MoaE [Stellaceae bacterium]